MSDSDRNWSNVGCAGPDSVVTLQGVLVSDGEDVWLVRADTDWFDRRSSVFVGPKELLSEILLREPGYACIGNVSLATDARVCGRLSASRGERYFRAFASINDMWLLNVTSNTWQRIDLQEPPNPDLGSGFVQPSELQ